MTELGELVRAHRKSRQLTLEAASGMADLSIRFLSEVERGKQTAEIGKVFKAMRTLGLEVIVQPSVGTEHDNRPSDDEQAAPIRMLQRADQNQ